MAREQRNANSETRRARLRLVLRWSAGALVAAGLCWTAFRVDQFLASDRRFHLNPAGLTVEGLKYAPRHAVLNVFGPDLGRSIYLMPLPARRRSLLTVDWIRDASIARYWPDRIHVRVLERHPVAFVMLPRPGGSAFWETALVDADGVLLNLPPRARFDLPALYGITREQPPQARRSRVQEAMALLNEVATYAAQISEIDVTDPDNLRITQTVEGRAVRLLLGNHRYLPRLRGFLEHYPDISRRLPNARVFDLRLDDRITALDTLSSTAKPEGGRHAR